jgi:multidrug efflux pump subunit AcrB
MWKKTRGWFEHVVESNVRSYDILLNKVMHSRFWRLFWIYGMMVFFLVSWLFPVQFNLFPQGDQPYMEVGVKLPIGTVVEETQKHVYPVENTLLEQPEVKLITSLINGNTATINVELFTAEERKAFGGRTSVDITNDLKHLFLSFKDAEVVVKNEQSGPPSESPVAIRVIATDSGRLDAAQKVVSDFKNILKQIPGSFGVTDDVTVTPGELRFKINRDVALALGVDPDSVASYARSALRGNTAATITRNGKDVDVVVRYDEATVGSIEDL